MKIRHRIGKAVKFGLLIILCFLVLTALSVYAILHNYIKKINIIDDDALIKANDTAPVHAGSDNYLDGDNSTMSKNEGKNDKTTHQTASVFYESYQGFKNQLNMQELNDSEEADINLSAAERYAAQGQKQDYTANNNFLENPSAGQNMAETDGKRKQSAKITETDDEQAEDNISSEYMEAMAEDKVMNLLLIGKDAASSDNTNTESFAVFTVNKRSKKLITTTFSGNIYLNIPGKGKGSLTDAYNIGGIDLVTQTLEKNFGLPISGFIMADYSAYIDMVDSIGGVEIAVAKDELAPVNRNIKEINKQLGNNSEDDLLSAHGNIVLNGKQALGYSRSWYSEKGDFISSGNQKAVIFSILSKVRSFNIIEMNGFLSEVLPKITTNLSESRIMELIVMLPVYFNYGIEYLSVPIKGTEKKIRVDGRTVLVYNSKQNLSSLHSLLYAMQ